jgi:CheY-like chemotaxis protein
VTRKRILIVEDVEDNRELLVQYFADEFEVLEAVDGRQGVAMAREARPDLILMDLSLPELDGWQAAAMLKTDERTRDIPIIAISAHAMVGDKERALAAGCNGYLAKPVDFPVLDRLVKQSLGDA